MDERGSHGAQARREVQRVIGLWIRRNRERLGLSQEGLARRLGQRGIHVDQSIVSRWEHGRTAVPVAVLPELGRSLGVSLESLAETIARARSRPRTELDLGDRSFSDLVHEGDLAARRGEFHQALVAYEAARDRARLSDTPLSDDDVADVLLRIAHVCRRLWFLDRCRLALQEVAALRDRISFPIRLRALLLRVTLEQRAGDPLAAELFAREARRRLRVAEGRLRTWGTHVLGHYEFAEDRYSRAIPLLQAAADGWKREGDSLQRARALAFLGYALARESSPADGRRLIEQARRMARESTGFEVEAVASLLLGRLLAETGEVTQGLELLSSAGSLAARLQLDELRFIAAWHGWRLSQETSDRRRFAQRLRRLAHRVSPLLPEHRKWMAAQGKEEER